MADISEINENQLLDFFTGKNILITAGPTREKIDDVRFISNFSSGKMGFALAEKTKHYGANVTLISGPVNLLPPEDVELINVESAEDMYLASVNLFPKTDIAIMTAAVADYTPINQFKGKLKKEQLGDEAVIKLKKTKDILAELSRRRTNNQTVVGFALESTDELEYGRNKLIDKACNMIVINSANKPDSGFGGNKNTISIISEKGFRKSYQPMLKSECAVEILKAISFYNH